MDQEFITYGFHVDKNLIRNNPKDLDFMQKSRFLNKPPFGLWGSPTDSSFGWKDWCRSQDFNTDTLDVYTKWRLKDDAKILIVDSFQDLVEAMNRYGKNYPKIPFIYYLDFLKIRHDFDGMWLTEKGNSECHFPHNYKNGHIELNAWDCDSIVIWNPAIIQITETN